MPRHWTLTGHLLDTHWTPTALRSQGEPPRRVASVAQNFPALPSVAYVASVAQRCSRRPRRATSPSVACVASAGQGRHAADPTLSRPALSPPRSSALIQPSSNTRFPSSPPHSCPPSSNPHPTLIQPSRPAFSPPRSSPPRGRPKAMRSAECVLPSGLESAGLQIELCGACWTIPGFQKVQQRHGDVDAVVTLKALQELLPL